MRSTRLHIHICFGNFTRSIALTNQCYNGLFRIDQFLHAIHINIAITVLLDLQFISIVQEIVDAFIVDFDVADSVAKTREKVIALSLEGSNSKGQTSKHSFDPPSHSSLGIFHESKVLLCLAHRRRPSWYESCLFRWKRHAKQNAHYQPIRIGNADGHANTKLGRNATSTWLEFTFQIGISRIDWIPNSNVTFWTMTSLECRSRISNDPLNHSNVYILIEAHWHCRWHF